MQNTTESFETEAEKQIYWQFVESGRTQSYSYLLLMYVCGIFYILLSAAPKMLPSLFPPNFTDAALPYRVYYPYINSYVEEYYSALLIHCMLGLFLRMTTVNAVDAIMILFINHACALFATISYRMDHLLDEEEKGNEKALKGTAKDSLKVVGYCVDRHNEIAYFMDLVEGVFSTLFFVRYGLITINLSFTLVQAAADNQSIHRSCKFLSSCAAQVIHLFIQANTAQDVINYSEATHQSIYASQWDRMPLRTQRALRTMMMKTMTPCTFSVGKVLVISFETYSAILRTSASYFTVLQSFQ
ncbi:hypothetical protein KM043_010135 [Ampulex compressa]|nr:hypothetical protein KM043_010135 [Ampulex compressa]